MKFLNHLQLNYNELQNATLHNASTGGAPSSAVAGTMFYNTTLSLPQWYDGSAWRDFGSITQFAVDTAVVSGDHLLFSDESVATDPNNKITIDNLIGTGLQHVTEAAIANGDYMLFLDGGATGTAKKEALHDIATLFAGSGLTATNSVIAVDTLNQDTSGTAAIATSITAVANNSTDETVYLTFVDGATGTQGIETDTGLYYNPSTGLLTATTFSGSIATATEATNITAVANNSTDETVYPTFVDGATGTQGIETDTGLTYNPSSGILTGTQFTGAVVGNVTGNASGTAATVTTAAQTSITSLGTLTALTVDEVAINGKVITMTGSSSDTATMTVGTHGTLAITTTDDAAAAANMTLTADGTFEAIGTTITLDSGGAINLEPAAGSAILLDGTISVDAGVVTGATSVTSTAFVGALTGNVTGNASGTAATVTTAAQTNITSLGTLTALTVDDVAVNGKVITMTGSASDTATFTAGTHGTLSIVTVDDAAAAANIQITADGTVDIDSAGVLTLDSGAAINIEPASGSAILLDGTISIDAGVVTGATSITSTAFVGDITGDLTGTADDATDAATAATFTVADESSDSACFPVFVTAASGNLPAKSGTNLTFNSSSGLLTATLFAGDITGDITGNADTATALATARTIGGTSFDGTGNITPANATLAAKCVVTDSTANTNFPVVFNDESSALLDDTGALYFNPSTGLLTVPNLSVAGTTTQVNTVTMNAANAVVFEGSTADGYETTLSIVDPTADHIQYLTNDTGYIPLLAAATTTTITSTPAELNILDGVTSTAAELNILDGVTSTAAELNILDGVTSTAAELNILDGVTSTAAELNLLDGVSGLVQADLTKLAAVDSTATELNILDAGTSGSSVALATGDSFIMGDASASNATKKVLMSDLEVFMEANLDTMGSQFTSASSLATVGTIGTGVWEGTDVTVAHGGTGVSTLTDGGVLLGNGTGAIVAMAVLADGEFIVGDGTTDPVAESGATLRTSIGVGTGDSPQFTGLNIGHATDSTITRAAAKHLKVEGFTMPIVATFLLNDDNDSDNPVNSNNDGAASTIFTITHGMVASRNYKVEIIQYSSNYDTVYADITRPSTTTIVVTFAAVVALGAYAAQVTYMGEHGA